MFFKHPPFLSDLIYQFTCYYNLHWQINYPFEQIDIYFIIYPLTAGDHIEMLDITFGNLSSLSATDEEYILLVIHRQTCIHQGQRLRGLVSKCHN